MDDEFEKPIGYLIGKQSYLGESPVEGKVRMSSYGITIVPIYPDTDVAALEEDYATLGRTNTWDEAVSIVEEWAAFQHMRVKRGDTLPD